MTLSGSLNTILDAELCSGNSIDGEYINEFGNCRILIVLRKPFQIEHTTPAQVEEFTNNDSHYPVGRGYRDNLYSEILMAPLA